MLGGEMILLGSPTVPCGAGRVTDGTLLSDP